MKKALLILAAVGLMATAATAQTGMARFAQKGHAATPQLMAANQLNGKRMPAKAVKHATKSMDNPLWADTMSYCLNAPYYTSIGMGSDTATMHWAIKIEPAALVGRNNITAVDFYVSAAGSYTMSLVFGATPTATAAYTQTVTAVDADTQTWKAVSLAAPVAVEEGQPLWVVFNNTGVPFPAASVMGNTYPNGTYASLDGVDWNVLTSFGASLTVTWMIRVVSDTYTVQAPMVELEGPAVALVNVPATYTISSPNSDSYEWILDGATLSETSNTLTHTFTAAGTYQLVAGGTNTEGTTYDTLDINVVDCSQPISTFPYTEGFENEIPCWSYVSADPANDSHTGIQATNAALEGNNVYVLSSYSRAEDYNQFLITPELDLPAGSQYVVHFWYMGDDAADAFRIRVSTTTADTAAFTTVLADLPEVATAWTEVAYILPEGAKYVAINYYGDYAYYLYIDRFSIEEMGVPSVTLEGPASVGTGNSATFSAHALMAESLAWHVDGTAVPGATGETFTTTFTTAAMHQVVVEAINSNGSAYDTLEVDVFSCDGITLPYTPDFSQGLGCWYNESRLTAGMGWLASAEAMETPVGQVVSFSGQSSIFGVMDMPVDNWMFSPIITMPAAGGNYEVAWQVMAGGAPNYPGDHYGLYLIAGTDTTLLFDETLTANDSEFNQRIVMLPADLNGDFRVAFRHFECAGGYAIALDQIELRAQSAAIVTLRGPESVAMGDEATFTAVSSNADSYAWTVDGTAVSETSNTLTHTFTTAGSHTVAVTATNVVGSNSASLTVNVVDCSITQFPYTNGFENEADNACWNLFSVDVMDRGFVFNDNGDYARTGNGSLFGTYSDDVNVDQWAISPAIVLPATATNFILEWYVKLNEWEGIPNSYEVKLSTTGRDQASFTTTLYSENGGNEDYELRNVSLADYAGQTVYIAFHNITAVGGDAIAFDDLYIGEGEVGIDQVAASAISVSPNPATGMVNVSAEGVEGRVSVEIVNLNGRTVMQQQGTAASYRFDVSGLAAGAYFVRLTGENTNAVQKLIVK